MMSQSMWTSSSPAVRTGRWMARREEPFAVFLFGMRLNRLRGLPRFLWGLRVLRRVLVSGDDGLDLRRRRRGRSHDVVQRQPIPAGVQAAGLECHVQPSAVTPASTRRFTAMVQAPLSWSWVSW
jgi:hypothetical protein